MKILKDNGFSILGLLVVVSIIIIALTISVPWRATVRRKGATEFTRKKMDIIEEALLKYHRYHVAHGTFPANLSDLEAGEYIDDDFGDDDYLYDEWNESFCYLPGTVNTCYLWSKGPNKTDNNGAPDDIPVNPGTTVISAAGVQKEKVHETEEEIKIIKDAGLAWIDKTGNWPANLMNLQPWYLWDPSCYTDSWGNLYVIYKENSAIPNDFDCIYSMGPNGIDDSGGGWTLGGGDDILISSSTV